MVAQWEWAILLLLVLGLLIAELVSIRRSIRRAKDAASPPPPGDAER
jgi:hypothetical protein